MNENPSPQIQLIETFPKYIKCRQITSENNRKKKNDIKFSFYIIKITLVNKQFFIFDAHIFFLYIYNYYEAQKDTINQSNRCF